MTRTEKNTLATEITHPGHPGHTLQLMVADAQFDCNGCKQPGKGRSYRCEECDYDIHTRCAPKETELSFKHPLFDNCKFDFLLEPPGPRRWCDACGDDVLGFMYYNRDLNIDLHPRCAFLQQRSDQQGVIYDLHTKKDTAQVCRKCEQKGSRRNSFWSYRARVDGELVYVHVGCIMDGSDIKKGQSVPPPTTVVNNPGQPWYTTLWKITKSVWKLTVCVFTFDAMGAYSAFEEMFNG